MEVLVYIGPLIVVFLAAGALATERQGLWEEVSERQGCPSARVCVM